MVTTIPPHAELTECHNRYCRMFAAAIAVRGAGPRAELLADQARAAYQDALLAVRDNCKPHELFAIASEHPIAFDVWTRDLGDWDKLALLRRLMAGAPERFSQEAA
jgi:hypothetical protein